MRNVWKTYQLGEIPLHAVKGMDLKIDRGDFMVVLGASGSGKSTLMNLMGALDVPSKGHIYLDGDDISKMEESDLAQARGKKIGFVFQQFNLMPVLTALQNVMMPMIFLGIPQEEREKRGKELLSVVGLGERMDHKPGELSGGEQQRVAIARSLANDPEVILADEPTGNLDSKTGEQIMKLIGDLHRNEKKTIIMVTHDINLVKYAHRTIYLKDGKIIRDGRRKKRR